MNKQIANMIYGLLIGCVCLATSSAWGVTEVKSVEKDAEISDKDS